jgi:hypothetical protein
MFISNKEKHHISLLIFFFFYKIREQEGRTGPLWGAGVTCGRRVNTVQKMCTQVCNWGRGDKAEGWRG